MRLRRGIDSRKYYSQFTFSVLEPFETAHQRDMRWHLLQKNVRKDNFLFWEIVFFDYSTSNLQAGGNRI